MKLRHTFEIGKAFTKKANQTFCIFNFPKLREKPCKLHTQISPCVRIDRNQLQTSGKLGKFLGKLM